MRVALFGSPSFALPSLRALHAHHELALVVAQPDKPAGRGHKLRAPPAAQWAREMGVRLEQPGRLKRNEAFWELLRGLEVDAAVTAAYGKILPQALLDIPEHGFLNVHASLLPKYRGAAPIQWALIGGERETGVSIMQTEAGLDTGPVRLQKRVPIEPDDTAVTLFDKLALLGAEALMEALGRLERGELSRCPQNDADATYANLLTKEDGRVRWEDPAEAVYNRFRGVYAWPGSWTLRGGRVLKLRTLTPVPGRGAPGEVVGVSAEGVAVAAGAGTVLLETVQPAGKPKMSARDWANGYGVREGERLG